MAGLAEEIAHRSSPSGHIVHDAILKEGDAELARPTTALLWSGLAAGLSMGFSFLGQGLLRALLPDESWAPLVASFGNTLGFLIVILGRQQLFTENTLTVILPLMRNKDLRTLGNVVRLWAAVLVANLGGAFVVALVLARTHVVDADTYRALRDAAAWSTPPTFGTAFVRGIFAGWLIALVVWLLPFAESARIWVIVILTYFVGLGAMTHVIVTTIETAFLVFVGDRSWTELFTRSLVPGLLGNIVGGVALVAALNHAQVVSGAHAHAHGH